MESVKKILFEKIRAYRVIKLEQILKFEKDGSFYEFQVIDLATYSQLSSGSSEDSDATPTEEASLLDPDLRYLNLPRLLQSVELSLAPNQ